MSNTQKKVILFLSLLISTTGLLVLLGWLFDIEYLKRPIPNLVAMNPVTSIGFILSGIAIYSTLKQTTSENKFKWLALFTTALIILIGLLKLSDLFFSTSINEEEWLFSYKILNDKLVNVSSRIAPGTALNFILLGIALILSNTNKPINKPINKSIANYLALIAFLIGLFSTFGYVYNVPEFTEILAAHPMAVHTAICFLFASFGVMLINYNNGYVHDFSGSGATAFTTKVLIPGIVLFPFFLGLLLLYIVHNYNISAELVVAFGVSGITIIFFLITWYISRQLNKISAKRDEAENALKLSHERFFKFFKSSPVATSIVTIKDGRFVHTNKAFLKLFSYSREQVIGKTSLELNMVDPQLRANIRQKAKENNYTLQNIEIDLRDAHGNIKHIISSTETIEIEGELHMLNTLVDITERKETEEKLRQYYIQLEAKSKELEQFAFIASHDLQEPLRTISSFTGLLNEEYAPKLDNNANTYIRFISQSAKRMRDLINGLLDYSRLGNQVVLNETDCNLILKNALENLHVSIQETNAAIKSETLPVLKAYPTELELLFQNLISNAIKFRKKDKPPQITINAEKKEKEWIFSVADNGIGIEEKYFEKIFLLFQRLHSRDKYEGAGIGLAHCKKIVDLHNGKIWVQSKSGEGSVFYFSIPETQIE